MTLPVMTLSKMHWSKMTPDLTGNSKIRLVIKAPSIMTHRVTNFTVTPIVIKSNVILLNVVTPFPRMPCYNCSVLQSIDMLL